MTPLLQASGMELQLARQPDPQGAPYTFTNTNFTTLANSTDCPPLNNNPNKILCYLTVNPEPGAKPMVGSLPVIIYRGLRAHTIDELIADRQAEIISQQLPPIIPPNQQPPLTLTKPYYVEISAQPSDFTGTAATPVVDLSTYFTTAATNESITYALDATNIACVGGPCKSAPCPVKLITGVNQSFLPPNQVKKAECVPLDRFFIQKTSNTPTKSMLMAKNLTSGIYQINVHAQAQVTAERSAKGWVNEDAWQTFYINVNPNNPTLANWTTTGAVASTNVIGTFPSIYVYSANDPTNSSSALWTQDIASYSNDLQQINNDFLSGFSIKTAFFEMMDMQYINQTYWPLDPTQTNPIAQITPNGVNTGRPTINTWISDLTTPFNTINVGITMGYTFLNNVKGDFISYNETQQDIFANTLTAPILNPTYGIDGVDMDLEGGFNQPGAVALYKKITDRLAYQGKWFSWFGFGDEFGPDMYAAFGPLGVGSISTYDVGNFRAPVESDGPPGAPLNLAPQLYIDPNTAQNSTFKVPYTQGGFTLTGGPGAYSGTAYQMYTNFNNDLSCTTISPTTPPTGPFTYHPVGGCNLSTNDSYSENERRFNDNSGNTLVSPKNAVIYFNGKYQLAFPLAASGSEWAALEIWTPDFTSKVFHQGKVVTTTVCGTDDSTNIGTCNSSGPVDNNFFASCQSYLTDKTSVAYKTLQDCLMNTPNSNVAPSVPMQSFSQCAKDVPYSECILVSGLPGSQSISGPPQTPPTNPGIISYSGPNNYVCINNTVYADTNTAHAAGYAVFALNNTAAGEKGAFLPYDSTPPVTNNLVSSEPWYIGFNPPTVPWDPFYNSNYNKAVWTRFASILNGAPCTPTTNLEPDFLNFSFLDHLE